jgi:plasmid stabilization system protein ParE
MSEKKRLEWSIRSALNMEGIRDHIEQDNPAAALSVLAEIRKRAKGLLAFPMIGHEGKRPGTRELVLQKYPYTIIYRLTADKVRIVAVVHQRQR